MTGGALAAILGRLYRLLLRLYSPDWRKEFGEEMEAVFAERMATGAAGGRLNLLAVGGHEIAGVLVEAARERAYALLARPTVVAQASGGLAVLGLAQRPRRRSTYLAFGLIWLFLCAWLSLMVGANWWYVTLDGTPDVRQVALADLNGDGRLDAFLAIGSTGDRLFHPDYVLLNDGDGRFRDSGQEVGSLITHSVVVGDVDGDGRPEAIVDQGAATHVHEQREGRGIFGAADFNYLPVSMPGNARRNLALGDLDGDGRLDLFIAGCCGFLVTYGNGDRGERHLPFSTVWLNNGRGTGAGALTDSRQRLGQAGSNGVALGDVNGDGALDAFLANGQTINDSLARGEGFIDLVRFVAWANGLGRNSSATYDHETPNTVWLNDGQGQFRDSGQQLGQTESMAVALGDVNGDGFLDAVVGNNGADEVWLNDGRGGFHDSGQRLGRGATYHVFLADLDGDGDLDFWAAGETGGRGWLNDGSGRFSGGQRIRYGRYEAAAVGDVTGDGVPDVFVAGAESYQVWRGLGNGQFATDGRIGYR